MVLEKHTCSLIKMGTWFVINFLHPWTKTKNISVKVCMVTVIPRTISHTDNCWGSFKTLELTGSHLLTYLWTFISNLKISCFIFLFFFFYICLLICRILSGKLCIYSVKAKTKFPPDAISNAPQKSFKNISWRHVVAVKNPAMLDLKCTVSPQIEES